MSKDSKKERDIEREMDQQSKLKNLRMQLDVYKEVLEVIMQEPDLNHEKKEKAEFFLTKLNQLDKLSSESDRKDVKFLMGKINEEFPEIKQAGVNTPTLSKRDLLFTKIPPQMSSSRNIERNIDQQSKLENVKKQLGFYKETLEVIKKSPDLLDERRDDAEFLLEKLTKRLNKLSSESDRQKAKILMSVIDTKFPEIKQAVIIPTLPKRELLFTKRSPPSSLHEPAKAPRTPPETSPRDEGEDSHLTNKRGGGKG